MTRYRQTDVPQRATPPPQRTRIDWGVAKAYYVALPTSERSFARVAREYRVTPLTVRKHAHRDGWVEAAADADRSQAEAAMVTALGTIEERNAEFIKVASRLRSIALDPQSVIDANVAVRALPRYQEKELLIAGEATGRIELGDAQAIIAAVFTVAGRFVPADRRDEFLGELDGAVGGLVAINGGKGAA